MSRSDQNEWDEIAGNYNRVAGTARDPVYDNLKTCLWSALGEIRGLTILDLGCGAGWLAVELARRGARVIGVDGSAELIRRARTRLPTAQWILHDLREGLPRLAEPEMIDHVISHMALMDFDPLEPLLDSLESLLPEGAPVTVTLPHPGFFNYKSGQDDEGAFRRVRHYLRPETWHIETYGGHTHYHRPLSFYVNSFGRHGFRLMRFEEPEYKNETPIFCLLQFGKAAV